MNTHYCSKCKLNKPLSEFSRDASRESNVYPWCSPCRMLDRKEKERQNESDKLNGFVCPVDDTPIRGHANRRFCSGKCKRYARHVRFQYGVTIEQVRQMIHATGGVCPVCSKVPQMWVVDHDHTTGRVMGVVCTPCNIGAVSRTFHDIEFIKRLLDYVENPPSVAAGVDVIAPREPQPAKLHNMWSQTRGPATDT